MDDDAVADPSPTEACASKRQHRVGPGGGSGSGGGLLDCPHAAKWAEEELQPLLSELRGMDARGCGERLTRLARDSPARLDTLFRAIDPLTAEVPTQPESRTPRRKDALIRTMHPFPSEVVTQP